MIIKLASGNVNTRGPIRKINRESCGNLMISQTDLFVSSRVCGTVLVDRLIGKMVGCDDGWGDKHSDK